MNTFWGCETENLTELSGVVAARSLRMRAIVLQIALSVRAVGWIGPDAEDYRQRTEDLVDRALELIETLRRLGEVLGREAEEQDLCSQPDGVLPGVGDPLGVRTELPWTPGGGFRVPSLHRRPLSPWTMPLAAPLEERDPRDPLPAGEDFALDPDGLAGAARLRRKLVGQIPVAGLLQYAPALHEGVGDVFDGIEQGLEDHGLGAFRPVVSLARIPHEISGVTIGEDSLLGHTVSAVDRSIANVGQTGREVFTEIGDGDLSGAIRAGERGLYRNADISADLLTASPVPAAAGAASHIIGTGADLIEPFAPDAAQHVRDVEEVARRTGERWEQGQDQLTDPEFYYDLRRTYAPMPWDPQG